MSFIDLSLPRGTYDLALIRADINTRLPIGVAAVLDGIIRPGAVRVEVRQDDLHLDNGRILVLVSRLTEGELHNASLLLSAIMAVLVSLTEEHVVRYAAITIMSMDGRLGTALAEIRNPSWKSWGDQVVPEPDVDRLARQVEALLGQIGDEGQTRILRLVQSGARRCQELIAARRHDE